MDKHKRMLLSPLLYIGAFMLVVYLGVNLTTSKVTYSACSSGHYDNTGNCIEDSLEVKTCSCYLCKGGTYASTPSFSGAQLTHAQCESQCSSLYLDTFWGTTPTSNSCTTPTITANRVCFKDAGGYIDQCDVLGCDVGSDGKIVSSCPVDRLSTVCSRWSFTKWDGVEGSNNQGAGLSVSDIKNYTFNSNATLYCISGYSVHSSGQSSTEPQPSTTCSNPNALSTVYECLLLGNRCYNGYTGCTENDKDGDGCYTFRCNSTNNPVCTDDTLKTVAACKQTANTKCGDAGYNGCTEKNASNNCYTYSCNTSNPTVSCYTCDVKGSQLSIRATSEVDAANRTDGVNCTKVDDSKCYGDNNVVNPTTGGTAIIFVWLIGIMAIGYAFWYYKKVSSMNV